jgi:oligopeptide/dipeptide ABC transporter ATP-binding protein
MRSIRGAEIGMIFQEPMSSLNPVFRVGDQIAEVLELHRGLDRDAARKEAIQLLDRVGIPAPESRIRQYPHELSGGMKQRVMIAIALACDPDLLIADEPTTALDVTIQAQILDLLSELRRDLDMAVLLITHDLGVVAQFSERVMVMYAGEIVERCDTRTLFRNPAHPYTRALLGALPHPDEKRRLVAIEGNVPSPLHYPPGCAFADRCRDEMPRCKSEPPPEKSHPGADGRGEAPGDDHRVRCWLYEEGAK